MSEEPQRIEELITSLKQQRDELSVKIHLTGMEMREEWDRLDMKLSKLCSKYEPVKDAVGETSGDVWQTLKQLGSEIGDGFKRIGKAIQSHDK
ncbi:MAG: hypothetical protein HQ518_03035 [Rhodopirellula sp.]|jgi:uncharacterized coiled-coil DUF342 family protein|nr:hypothetical protein [Rhodopirellula sp.]